MFLFMVASEEYASPKAKQAKIDEGLLVRIGENDSEALATLYELTERSVYALVLSILRDPYSTQDVVQETYLKIRSAAHLYKPQGKPLAWIFTIAKHLAYNALRQNGGSATCDAEVPENDLRYSCVCDPTDKLTLSAALDILQEDERQIVLLHAVSGVTHIEIARSFDLPLSTVLSRYHRALKKLKKHLTQKGAFE